MLNRFFLLSFCSLFLFSCRNSDKSYPPMKIDPAKILREANIKTTPAMCPPASAFAFNNGSWGFRDTQFDENNWLIESSDLPTITGFQSFNSAKFSGTAVNGNITCIDTDSTPIAVKYQPSVVIPLGPNWEKSDPNSPVCSGPVASNCPFGRINRDSTIIKKLPNGGQ